MKITCPNCEAGFMLADGTLGATGRKVRCTRCGTVWHAMPVSADDLAPEPVEAPAFADPGPDEWRRALREDPVPPPPDTDGAAGPAAPAPAAAAVVPFRANDRSQEPTIDAAPAGFESPRPARRARPLPKSARPAPRFARLASSSAATLVAGALLVVLLTGGVFARESLVRLFPDLASLYSVVGLDVNLRGVEFTDVKTTRELDGATPVLVVEGTIRSVDDTGTRPLAKLRLALLSQTGREVYAWEMDPPRSTLTPGATANFKSRLPAPPEAGTTVEIRFKDGR